MSLVKVANVSEDNGEVDICVQFSSQFAESFEIFLNASASFRTTSVGENVKCSCHCIIDWINYLDCVSTAQLGVDYMLPTPVTVSSDHSRNGKACLNLTVIDDGSAEADECLVVTVAATKPIAPVSDFFCIIDNDGNTYSSVAKDFTLVIHIQVSRCRFRGQHICFWKVRVWWMSVWKSLVSLGRPFK